MNVNTATYATTDKAEKTLQIIEAFTGYKIKDKKNTSSFRADKHDSSPEIEHYNNYSKTGVHIGNSPAQQAASPVPTTARFCSYSSNYLHFSQDTTADIKAWNEWEDPVRRQKDDLVNKIYGQRAAESRRMPNPVLHARRRYFDSSAPHYVGHDLHDWERHAAWGNELTLVVNDVITRINSTDVDPIFEGRGLTPNSRRGSKVDIPWTRGIIGTGLRSVAGQRLHNRNMANSQLNDLLARNGVQIPEGTRLSFQIDSLYNLTVKGTDDENLKKRIEELLNKNGNSFQLYRHIMDSTRTVASERLSNQVRDDSLRLYRIDSSIRRYTDYNRQDLKLVDGKFLTRDGVDIMEHIKQGMAEVYQGDGGILVEQMNKELQWLANVGPDNIPEMVLTIDFKNGNLFDVGQPHGYGPGQTNWISNLLGGKDPHDSKSWL